MIRDSDQLRLENSRVNLRERSDLQLTLAHGGFGELAKLTM